MGKNRKLKNGVYQEQNYSVIEAENQTEEIPQDFLTSDDFCIVQRKRGKKFSENQGSACLSQSLSNSRKSLSDEETSKSHMSFWTCKFNGPVTSSSASDSPTEFGLNYSSDELDITSLNSEFCAIEIAEPCEKNILEGTSGNSTAVKENLSENVKFEASESVAIEDVLEIKSTFDKGMVAENNVCCTKKKSKKKGHRSNSVDQEIEMLLKQLELDETSKFEKKSNTGLCASPVCYKSSHELNCQNNANYMDNKIRKGISKVESFELKAEAENNSLVILPIAKKESNDENSEQTGTEEAVYTEKEDNVTKTSSQKRKGKRAKAKRKLIENGCLKISDICERNSKDLSVVEESVNANSVSNYNIEEKDSKSKSCGESNKRSKKRLGKKQLAIIHEALKKAKEEEDRLRREEEAKEKLAEEAEKIRLEKLRMEQERKERKKLKEKQRREKMKAEGRLLSKSQKQSRARMEATLAAFRQQGIDVPQISDKKPLGTHGPRLGNCKNFHRKRLDSCQSTHSSDSAIVILDRQKSESFSSQESSVKDILSDLPSSFDSTDESALIPESDRGNFSCSEESDGLDDNISCDISRNKKKNDSITFEKLKHNKIGNLTHTISSESDHKVNSVKYRSPVVCVLGHVDTGKTKLLDYIRKTHVQDSEAGGITQQIGATMIPQDALKEKCKMVKGFSTFNLKIPGLLVIDTPGHEFFSNLRSRGSSICDIAILVVDIMHGLEAQTIESINLLKKGKTPFVVALNKIDRIYGWKSAKDEDIENTIQSQAQSTQIHFKKRYEEIIAQFANECLNATLFYENKDPRTYVSMVPISAITGDGMGNLLNIITQLTQSLMHKKLIYSDELEATVLEVKAIPGLGTTIDVILVNGHLQEGDTIVLAGQEGPIVSQIRSLLMPQPLKELRVKNPYIEYKTIEGAQGVKISGRDLDKSIAGLPLLVASNHSMIDVIKDEINHLFRETMNSIKTSERGVYVQASTLGSLEALLDFLTVSGIPYFNVKIGPVVKKDVMKASVMLEHDVMYAAILAFDVKIERDAQELAESLGVHIFQADIIYHLFDKYINYREKLLLKRQEEIEQFAVFPCKLKIIPELVINSRAPIVLGVYVEEGSLREGTPLCVASSDILEIGTVSSIETNGKKTTCAKKGDEVYIKIEPKPGETPLTYGKHFSDEDLLVSRISRQSIDVCKEHFRDKLQSCDWHLIVELKKMLNIV